MHLEPLPTDNVSHPSSISDEALVLTPQSLQGYDNDLTASRQRESLEATGSKIKQHVDKHGALILRGFDLGGTAGFQNWLSSLGYDLMDSNLGGASPRPRVAGKVFVSTAAPKPFIIGFHTEFVYQQKRPGMIAFYCQVAPERLGETPIFDCARVFADLPESVQHKLLTLGVRYHRRFYGRRSFFNYRKTWQDVFDTQERGEVEAYLENEGMQFQWNRDDSLVTSLNMPAVLHDPDTQKPLLSITMFNGESFAYNIWHFQERYRFLTRCAMDYLVRRETQEGRRFLYITWGDGSPFTREESEAIQKAAWNNAVIFKWRENDVILLNNKRWAHARLNVGDRRKIVVAMGDQYDLRDSPYWRQRPTSIAA